MAKTTLSPVLRQLRGKVGNLVFRQLYGKTVVSRAPDFSRRKLSAKQQAQVRRFADAVRHARATLADPKTRAAYAVQAKRQSRPLISVAIRDYFKSAGK
jgi:hypothetical protein